MHGGCSINICRKKQMNTHKIMSSGDNAMKKVQKDRGIECNRKATSVKVVRNGFSLQITVEQRSECNEEVSHANNWRVSLAGKWNG